MIRGVKKEEFADWKGLELTRVVLEVVRSHILDRVVRVVDLPRDLWVENLDAVKGMHEILDILEGIGEEEV